MYEVQVEFSNETEDAKGNVRVKKNKENYLVSEALSVEYATKKVSDYLKDTVTPWEILTIKKSNVNVIIGPGFDGE